MRKIVEKIETPVSYECDVAVVGGGVAGISAALAAARSGARVTLLERSHILGGLATAGLVTIYLPLCDGQGEQVSFGIAEELLRLSVLHGSDDVRKHPLPTCWLGEGTREERVACRFALQFNPWLFALDAERVLLECGVKIIYGATAVSTTLDGDRITNIVIEGKGGREAIAVNRCVVDCTGDCDIAHMSGTPTAEYSYGNKLAAWYYYRSSERDNALTMLGVCDDLTSSGPDLTLKRYRALSTDEISEMMIESHISTYLDFLARRKNDENIFPTAMATTPQVRMTRRIVGEYTMSDTELRVHYDDSVGAFSDWRKRGPAYELPLRTLYSSHTKNLFVAGRCISVTDDMWDITRVIPVCAVSGEAAGVAAAMCRDVDELDVTSLQRELTSRGVKIHL